MRTSPMYALPVLKEGCPGGGWAGSCTGAGLEHSLASWLSRTNLEVLFCALNDISALLSQVKRSRRKQAPNSSCCIDLLVNSSPFPLFKLINPVHCSVFFIDFSQHLWRELEALLLWSAYLPGPVARVAKGWLCEHPMRDGGAGHWTPQGPGDQGLGVVGMSPFPMPHESCLLACKHLFFFFPSA